MTGDRRILNALLRSDFRAFVHKVFLTLTPGQPFIRSWHLDAIAYHLSQIANGECKRLVITMPPGSLKSLSASVAFPAWMLGRDQSDRDAEVGAAAQHVVGVEEAEGEAHERRLRPQRDVALVPGEADADDFLALVHAPGDVADVAHGGGVRPRRGTCEREAGNF